jgi:nitrous oxidase accessory protein
VNARKFNPSGVRTSASISQTSVIYVPGDYSTIQAAVNAASSGDIISIASGVYYENVVMNKSVKILGENSNSTVVRGVAGNFTPTIEVRADYVEISGITARNGLAGIYLNGSNYCNVHGNILTATAWGGGISLAHSNNNTIVDNIAIDNGVPGDLGGGIGISVGYSNNNLISGNLITKNVVGTIGLLISGSNDNIIIDNRFNQYGGGILLSGSTQNIVSFNKFESSGGVGLGSSSNNTIEHNWIVDGGGIGLQYSSVMNVIRGNTILRSDAGIGIADDFSHVGKNLVIENTVRDSKIGIDISFSNFSTFYHNNFINNTNNHPDPAIGEVFPHLNINFWNDSFGEGNYWSNYTGVDANRDGIGDTPHSLYIYNQDYYPLMKPYIPGDCNHDGIVNIKDGALVGVAWNTVKGTVEYNPHADLNTDETINTADADIIRKNWQKHI